MFYDVFLAITISLCIILLDRQEALFFLNHRYVCSISILCLNFDQINQEKNVSFTSLGQDDSYDFGSGAGFYVNATEPKWSKHYKMYDYVTKELPDVVNALFPVDPIHKSIMGHSMGGHGALISYLKNPGIYTSVSAFSPICNPTQCPWGEKAFNG